MSKTGEKMIGGESGEKTGMLCLIKKSMDSQSALNREVGIFAGRIPDPTNSFLLFRAAKEN